jgi:hypothetical protein
MKKAWKYFVAVVLPVSGLSALFGSCASTTTCNNDACYDRNISSADPYRKGDIAAWGTEKEVAKQEQEEQERKADRMMNVNGRFNR